jgi:glycerol uptake facilitator-like aquaporin
LTRSAPLSRRLAAEALGTGLLVATVVGSGIMAERLTDDVAVALLANTLPTVAILVVLISLFGPISGAHFNPAVSLVFALRRELSSRDLAAYIVVQVIGGIAGAWLVHLMFEAPVLQLSTHIRTGPAQWLSEGVATFGLVLTILIGLRQRPDAVPVLVGLYIGAAYWFTASTSFANPAVTIARALTDSFSGIRPVDAPGFIVMQILGALLAAVIAGWLAGPARETQP